jgi:hypothetical protein
MKDLPCLEPANVFKGSVSEMAGDVCHYAPQPSLPAALVGLIILTGVHILLYFLVLLVTCANHDAGGMTCGIVTCGFFVAILIGLVKMQEWARVMLIWFCYVGIIFSVLLLSPLEITTLVFAHRRSVREATKAMSIARVYTYHENTQNKKW